jgi:hypothetical protein
MPDAGGNIKGIALTGKAGETLERIKQAAQYCPDRPECQTCPAADEDDVCLCRHCGDTGLVTSRSHEDYCISFESEACEHCANGRAQMFVKPCEDCGNAEAECDINGMDLCEDCWERGMNLD